MSNITKEYTNDEITVIWTADLCIHAAECVKGLPLVFNPEKRPWIDIKAANSSELMETINKCPSGALTYKKSNGQKDKKEPENISTKINVLKNGPLIVKGNFEIFDSDNTKLETKSTVALCRCGASKNHPFCDGKHTEVGFID